MSELTRLKPRASCDCLESWKVAWCGKHYPDQNCSIGVWGSTWCVPQKGMQMVSVEGFWNWCFVDAAGPAFNWFHLMWMMGPSFSALPHLTSVLISDGITLSAKGDIHLMETLRSGHVSTKSAVEETVWETDFYQFLFITEQDVRMA
jgi:hypothetical protein